ncbi:MAG: methyltransferase domain-containing protein [Candidatus Diapherotrites archaeon]|nr:methyltransferase domain-containing protein [Candidatus Diapherotrites archaeon]
MKLLIHRGTGRRYLAKSLPFNTEFGLVRDVGPDGRAVSSKGEEFVVTEPSFVDLWLKMRRGPQWAHPKDLSVVVGLTGLGPGWKVVDAGTGSGFAANFFAYHVRPNGHVYSYDYREQHLRIGRENAEFFGLSDYVTFKHGSVYDGIDERDVDLVFLDLPEPWRAFAYAADALRPGGFLVLYLPTVDQVLRAKSELPDSFTPFDVYEVLLRRWKNTDILRPENTGLLHTAFILISRRV